MIQTRQTIYDTLIYKLKRLIKLADNDKIAFRKILYAIIINDMKEWAEFRGEKFETLENILKLYLLNECLFKLVRIREGLEDYKNVNTPLSNTYWQRIFDAEDSKIGAPVLVPKTPVYEWEVDNTCNPVMIYFTASDSSNPLATLYTLYGEHGEKLKTVCEKMNTYVDRVTGKAWYLDCSGNWKPIMNDSGITETRVVELVKANRGLILHLYSGENGDLYLNIVDNGNNPIRSASEDEINNIL